MTAPSSGATPRVKTLEQQVPAAGATVDTVTELGEGVEGSTVTKVAYLPTAAVTGANTNTRTLNLVNKGNAGAGTTVVATLALVSGVNLTAHDENAITLSGTAANLVVAAGDVLEWQSTHAASGLADPGGLVHVEVSRS